MTGLSCDVLVIGGGITGCAIARETSMRGYSTILVDKGDLAEGTSSRSTKLLHGGLRYLEHGRIRSVRQALREREITARLAPHLARPLPFVVPGVAGVAPGPRLARFGVALYDLLAGRNPLGKGRSLAPAEVASAWPGRPPASAFTGGVRFTDRQTEDARLTVAVARDAARRGAAIHTGLAVVSFLERGGTIVGATCSRADGDAVEILARAVVNATGPWADGVRRLAGLQGSLVRPTRGAHLVLPDIGLNAAVMLSGRRPRHRIFAIPWRGVTLFGTTDDDDDRDPALVKPARADVELLLDEASRHFPAARLDTGRVLSAFAGVRPLARAGGETLGVSRDHRIVDEKGLLTIVGGKLTTWRSTGEDVALLVSRRLGRPTRRLAASREEPLPGGDRQPASAAPDLETLDPRTRTHLAALYGSEAGDVASLAARDPEARRTIVEGSPEILAQVDFAVREEFARRVADVVWRRLVSGHDPSWVVSAVPVIARRMTVLLGWPKDKAASETQAALVLAGRGERAGHDRKEAP